MDDQYIRAHDIIGRYLLHELSDREEYEFEEYYFEHPEIMEELEIARAMRDGLRSEPVRKVLEAAIAGGRSTESASKPALPVSPEPGDQSSWPRRLRELIATPQWALSATAVAGVLAALLIVGPRGQPTGPLPVVAQLDLMRTRGEPETAPVEISVTGDGVVALTADAAGLDPNTLRGTIRSGSRAVADFPLASDAGLGLAKVVIPASSLPRGEYVLELRDDRGERLSYAFRVTR